VVNVPPRTEVADDPAQALAKAIRAAVRKPTESMGVESLEDYELSEAGSRAARGPAAIESIISIMKYRPTLTTSTFTK
jgi:hypothetical protein